MPGASSTPLRVEDRLARRGGAIELLRVPAALFGAGVAARGALYDSGLLSATRVDVPVVSVGNLTAGGTGKTPFCAWVVRALAQRGVQPGLLSRGYGAPNGSDEPNDEALVLARACPGVPHVQDKDRVRGARALASRGVGAIVLDDGFQHRRLFRDLDLVLVDATRPFGLPVTQPGEAAVRALLPRGLLRERPAALARAHALVLTRTDALDAGELEQLEAELGRWAPGRPVARSVHAARRWRDEHGVERALATLPPCEVDLATALGNPAAFEATVRRLGHTVREHRAFADHHRYSRADLFGLGTSRPLVVSAKDAVKIAPLGIAFLSLEIEIEITAGAAPLEALLDALPTNRAVRERSALHAGLHG